MKRLFTMLLTLSLALCGKEPTTMFMPQRTEPIVYDVGNETLEEATLEEDGKYYSYNDAFLLAQEEDKVIMITIVANDCKFCEKMEQEVISEDSVGDALEDDFVLVKVNEDEDAIPFGMSRMTTPTYMFIDKTEDILFMVSGSYPKDEFLEFLQQAKDKAKR